ncbi:hypothetical protein DVH24_042652 [Malus domestica]|uniref:Uncharacterized protein n=1 Tax=Malus domestica TaxID=3750 RepID=A0A498I1M7_MALDO|nr:hypothetical protein DVH24_042652 [Malus domestica]
MWGTYGNVYNLEISPLDCTYAPDVVSSSSDMSLSYWDYLSLLILRPLFAITVVFLFISVGWWLAWKLVLVHVPLVQEIFGLRKKPVQPKPPTRRFSKIYNTIEAHNSASKW